jgi:hypothetical protein
MKLILKVLRSTDRKSAAVAYHRKVFLLQVHLIPPMIMVLKLDPV